MSGDYMKRYIVVSITGGILFILLDALINANPLARDFLADFSPAMRTSVNVPAGIAIDLAYGFILAGLFLLLFSSLPGSAGIQKGISFALIAWFFRVAMGVASQWMMFNIPLQALLYSLLAGLFEMLALGILYGATLKPETAADN
jgi:hypothetical protein